MSEIHIPIPTITRKLEFDAGHRVLHHEGKCRHGHGHRYTAEVEVSAQKLDDLGRVVDFGVIKEKVGKWIDDEWDHNMILNPEDPLAAPEHVDLIGRKPFIMPEGYENPTAENIAAVLFVVAEGLLKDSGLLVESITIHETPNCSAKVDRARSAITHPFQGII